LEFPPANFHDKGAIDEKFRVSSRLLRVAQGNNESLRAAMDVARFRQMEPLVSCMG